MSGIVLKMMYSAITLAQMVTKNSQSRGNNELSMLKETTAQTLYIPCVIKSRNP